MRRSTKLALENLFSGCFFGIMLGTILCGIFGPNNIAAGIIITVTAITIADFSHKAIRRFINSL